MAGTVVLNDQLRQLSSYFGLSPAALATALHTNDLSTIANARSSNGSRAALASLVALQQRLDEMFTSHAGVERWLQSPSGYFGGETPFTYLAAGKTDRVNAALDAIEAGVFV